MAVGFRAHDHLVRDVGAAASSNHERLAKIVGRAAYAADILDERARGIRLRDFKQIGLPFHKKGIQITAASSADARERIPRRTCDRQSCKALVFLAISHRQPYVA
jgi:hypothetical protein